MTMFKQFFLFVCVAIFGSRILFAQTASSDERVDNSICNRLNQSQSSSLNLKATLIFKHKLIIITDDWQVFEIPNSHFLHSERQMLLNMTGVPLETKWPAFADLQDEDEEAKAAAHFRKIKNQITVIWSVDEKRPFIYMDAKTEAGVRYDLDADKLKVRKRKRQWVPSGKHDSVITDRRGMYVMTLHKASGRMIFFPWTIEFNRDGSARPGKQGQQMWMFIMVLKADHKERKMLIGSSSNPNEYREQIHLYEWEWRPLLRTNWGPLKGFHYRDVFYLFGQNKTYVFDGSNKASSSDELVYILSKMHTIDSVDYFVCQNAFRPEPSTLPGPTIPAEIWDLTLMPDEKINVGTIIVIVLCLILLLMGCVIGLLLFCNRKRQKHRKASDGGQGKGQGQGQAGELGGNKQANKIVIKEQPSKQSSSKVATQRSGPNAQKPETLSKQSLKVAGGGGSGSSLKH